MEYRIAAAGIVIHHDKILLVRYRDMQGNSFLVGPGGGVQPEEDLPRAVVRETKEETGLTVMPKHLLFVEDLLSLRCRMIKMWFFCEFVEGELVKTPEAADEGIVDVGWYRKDQLRQEIVYPTVIMSIDWNLLLCDCWQVQYLGLGRAQF